MGLVSVREQAIGHMTTAFHAMGSDLQVQVWGDPQLGESLCSLAPARIEILEQAWSRFRAGSELSRVNSLAGKTAIEISPDLQLLVAKMVEAAHLTHGLFQPTMARVIEALGYHRDFCELGNESSASALPSFTSVDGITLTGNVLEIEAGVALDPGAIGKGLAGDIVCAEFMAAGTTGVLANIGGDVVVAGTPGSDYWRVSVSDDSDLTSDSILGVAEKTVGGFAVATSSTARRTWGNGSHHVIDPRTGNMSDTDLIQATVVAPTGWQAEAYATAALVLGNQAGTQFLNNKGLTHFLVPVSKITTK